MADALKKRTAAVDPREIAKTAFYLEQGVGHGYSLPTIEQPFSTQRCPIKADGHPESRDLGSHQIGILATTIIC